MLESMLCVVFAMFAAVQALSSSYAHFSLTELADASVAAFEELEPW